MMRRPYTLATVVGCLWLLCGPMTFTRNAVAADGETRGQAPAAHVAIETIEQRLRQLAAQASSDDTDKDTILEIYTSALEHARAAKDTMEKAAAFSQARLQAPERLAALRQELTQEPSPPVQIVDAEQASIIVLEHRLAQAEADVTLAQATLKELESEPQRRGERRLEITRQTLKANAKLKELGQEILAPEKTPELAEARNEQLLQRRVGPHGLTTTIEATGRQLADMTTALRAFEEDFSSLQRRVAILEAAGLDIDNGIGLLLRQKRTTLPNLSHHRAQMKARRTRMSEAQMQIITLEEERHGLRNLPDAATRLLADAPAPVPPGVKTQIVQLLEARQGYLDTLMTDYNSYLTDLIKLDAAERKLVETGRRFADFIDQRVLWVRSAPRYSLLDVNEHANVFAAIFRAAVGLRYHISWCAMRGTTLASFLVAAVCWAFWSWRERVFGHAGAMWPRKPVKALRHRFVSPSRCSPTPCSWRRSGRACLPSSAGA